MWSWIYDSCGVSEERDIQPTTDDMAARLPFGKWWFVNDETLDTGTFAFPHHRALCDSHRKPGNGKFGSVGKTILQSLMAVHESPLLVFLWQFGTFGWSNEDLLLATKANTPFPFSMHVFPQQPYSPNTFAPRCSGAQLAIESFSISSEDVKRNVKLYVCLCGDTQIQSVVHKSSCLKSNANFVYWRCFLGYNAT